MESLGTGRNGAGIGRKGQEEAFPLPAPVPSDSIAGPPKSLYHKGNPKKPRCIMHRGFCFICFICFFFVYRISLPSWLYPSSIFGLLIGLREQ